MPKEIRSKFWFFTWNNYDNTPDYAQVLQSLKNLSYLVYGKEVAPVTGTPHLQGYMEFSIRTKLSTLKNISSLKPLHLEVPKHYDTWQECRGYCIKEGGEIFEWGTGTYDKVKSKKNMGKRTDIDDIRDAIVAGVIHNTESLESFPGLTYQGMLYADRVLRNARPVRACCPDVYWLYGRTGVGKSRYAHEFIDTLEQRREWRSWMSYDNKLKWFDGYDKHQIALFDDFRGGEAHFPTLLRICDRYVCRVEVKGASAWWCPSVIIFTSSQSLEAGFGHLGSDDRAEQFVRRVRHEGGGGEFCFDDPEQLRSFRSRIDSFLVPASVPPVSSPQPCNSPRSPCSEEGAQESKSEEVVHDTRMSPLWPTRGPVPVYGNGEIIDWEL